MASVDEVELPPLPRRQWSKNRMIQDLDAGTIALFALRDRPVHGSDLRTDDGDHFFRGHALGRDRIGGFPPLGKVAELQTAVAETLCLNVGVPASGFPALRQRSKAFCVPV